MNTQAAIEAAKIAAETAQRNSIITAVVAIFTVLITSVITIRTARKSNRLAKELGEKNLKSLEQKRYIDAISVERIKWINTMRDNFSDFLKLANVIQLQAQRYKTIDKEQYRERYTEITYKYNHIFLLLNQSELVSREIMSLQRMVLDALHENNVSKFNFENHINMMWELGFKYQVVLKSEWKRVKEENKMAKRLATKRCVKYI
ncbi:hypothetical protein [Bacillus proteolyticus]|uniref:hypothetical protein n=1 Tax=Bacillus proteolyticus TaxID=2026192 RepID=UPI003D072B4C